MQPAATVRYANVRFILFLFFSCFRLRRFCSSLFPLQKAGDPSSAHRAIREHSFEDIHLRLGKITPRKNPQDESHRDDLQQRQSLSSTNRGSPQSYLFFSAFLILRFALFPRHPLLMLPASKISPPTHYPSYAPGKNPHSHCTNPGWNAPHRANLHASFRVPPFAIFPLW